MALLLAAGWASAHHSVSAVFGDEIIELTGIITDMDWINPHTHIYLDVTDADGNVIATASAGTSGFKGSRKGTAFAAQRAAEQAARRGMDMGLRQIDVFIKGPGSGREAAIRSLQGAGLTVSSIRDVTPIPHNGCRPRKRRRV